MNALKKNLIIILFTTISSTLMAQVWGLKLGASFPQLQLDHNSISNFNHKTKDVNIHGGVTVDIKINNLISIEPGLMFYRKKMRNFKSNIFSEYRLSYLNIPVPIKFNYKKDEKTFFGYVGGYMDYGMNGEVIINKVYRDDAWPKSKEERKLKRTDFGTTFGVGIIFSTLQIEAFSNIGFVDLANNMDGITSIKNRNFGISCTLRFGTQGTDFE